MGDGPLHHARALDYLGEEHLAGTEQVAHLVHAVHQWPFDDLDRSRGGQPRFLGVLDDVPVDAVDQRVAKPFFHGRLPPLVLARLGVGIPFASRAGVALGDREQLLGSVVAPIQHGILHRLLEVGRDVLVDRQLAGVDDSHGETRCDRVVEEHRVDGFAHSVIAPEREGDVADSARGVGEGIVRLDPTNRLDEVPTVVAVLLDARGDGEDVGIEDDVLGREAGVLDEQPVAAGDDLLAPFQGIRLAALVECHDDHGGTVATAQSRLLEERIFTFFQADRVDHALPLDAAQARFDDAPVAGVDHHRHTGDIRLGHGEVEKTLHGGRPVGHALVHVDVDDLGTVLHLLPRDV